MPTVTDTTYESKHHHAYALIKENKYTAAEIAGILGLTEKSFASMRSVLRLMGLFHKSGEKGILYACTKEEYEESRAKTGKPVKVLTPSERLIAAQKREDRASSALTNANKRLADKSDDPILQLKAEIAERELKLASLILYELQSTPGTPTADTTPDAPNDAAETAAAILDTKARPGKNKPADDLA